MTQQLPQGWTIVQQPQQAQPQQPQGQLPQGWTVVNQMTPKQAGEAGVASAMQTVSPVFGGLVSKALGLGQRTEETQKADELINAPISDVGAALGFNLATNFSNEEIEQVFRSQFGDQSVRKDQGGNTYVTLNGKEYIINKPGLSKQDIGATIGNAISFIPASRIAGLAQTVAKRLGITALASGATQTAIESGQAMTGGEFSPGEVLAATALGPAGELIPALQQSRRLTPDAASLLPQLTPEQVATAQTIKAETGVSILPSQATQAQQDQLVNVVLARNPEIGPRVTERLRTQSQDAYNGVMSMMDALATSDAAATAALDVRTASKEAIEQARRYRTSQTNPIYIQSFSEASDGRIIIPKESVYSFEVNGSPFNISEAIQKASGSDRKKLIELKKTIDEAINVEELSSNLEKLHNAKRTLRDQAKRESAGANPTMSRYVAGIYNDAANAINESLNAVSPTYAEANRLYQELSPSVDAIEGPIGNIANISDDKLSQVRNRLFNWNEYNADVKSIRDAKQIIQTANPEAWNALLRNKLQQNLAEVGVDSAEEALDTNVNFIQQFWSKALSGKDKAMMMEALDGDARRNFSALSEAFMRARQRPAQSATVQLAAIEGKLAGQSGVADVVSAALDPNSSGLFQKLFSNPQVKERNVRILADILLDPNWTDRLSDIRKVGMETPKGGAMFAQLFRDALNQEAQNDSNQP